MGLLHACACVHVHMCVVNVLCSCYIRMLVFMLQLDLGARQRS